MSTSSQQMQKTLEKNKNLFKMGQNKKMIKTVTKNAHQLSAENNNFLHRISLCASCIIF